MSLATVQKGERGKPTGLWFLKTGGKSGPKSLCCAWEQWCFVSKIVRKKNTLHTLEVLEQFIRIMKVRPTFESEWLLLEVLSVHI